MDKKISELTQEQENLMIEVRNEWIKKIECPNDLTVKKVKPHIEWLYEFCGLKKPKIIVADSPFACRVAVGLVSYKNANEQIGYRVLNKIRKKIDSEILSNVEDDVKDDVKKHIASHVLKHVVMKLKERGSGWFSFSFRKLISKTFSDSIDNGYVYPCLSGDISDYAWCSSCDYLTRIGVVKNNNFSRYLEYLNSGIFYSIQLESVNIVCGNPEHVDRDPATGELHSEERKAVQWKDGLGLYFLRGVAFHEFLWKKVTSKTCDLKTILSIQNTEQRMAALSLEHNRLLLLNQMVQIDRQSMIQTNADLKSVEVEYILYKLRKEAGIFDEDNYFVFTTCPSTNRQYLEGVDPKVGEKGDVFECVASQFQITKEEFLSIGQHS